ncbi:MAG: PmoA family protein [Planctomycetaceae bacterium]|jgi:hypothetical protein|nr:PmoA family protein [Planctomycetaceae bacterium]
MKNNINFSSILPNNWFRFSTNLFVAFLNLLFFLLTIFFVTEIYSNKITGEEIMADKVNIIKGSDFYDVNISEKLFARYVKDFDGTPIIYPIYSSSNKLMTRSFPMEERNVVSRDHQHHRSFWFTHGKVNDTDFWLTDKNQKNIGKIVHKNFLKAEVSGGTTAIIVTENDWVSHNGEIICSDVRSFEFGVTGLGNRYIDFEVEVTAKIKKVTFYDTKEGTFGIRVADLLSIDEAKASAKKSEKNVSTISYIINADSKLDADAWGKRSAWVDYVGQFSDGEVAGIAILNHPSSFRYPTYWHVRTYGLFAANPFGERGFGVRKRQVENAGGNFELAKDKSFTLRYRIIFHNGDTKKAAIADEFKEYSHKKFGNL